MDHGPAAVDQAQGLATIVELAAILARHRMTSAISRLESGPIADQDYTFTSSQRCNVSTGEVELHPSGEVHAIQISR